MKRLFITLAALIFAASFFTDTAQAAEKLSIEQVKLAPPDMDVYVRTSDNSDFSSVKPSDITADLSGHSYTVKSIENEGNTTDGVFYAFMLDVSASIPQDSLDAAVGAIREIANDMNSADKLAVITFGDKVNVVSDGSKPVKSTLQALKGIKADDQNTAFYSAMDSLIKVTKKAGDLRTVAVVFSDGVEDTKGDMTEDELIDTLKQSGVAVYAMQVGKNVTSTTTRHLKKFIKVTGGKVLEFNASNAKKTVKSLVGNLDSVYRLQLLADQDFDIEKNSKLTVKVKGYDTLTWTVNKTAWSVADGNPAIKKRDVKSDGSSDNSQSEQASADASVPINTKKISRQRKIITFAIIGVVAVAAAVVAVLSIIQRRKSIDAYYKNQGLDPHEIEEIKKKIRQKKWRK
ncbi:MAG: vWA domain-containing protein [Candidatus Weimeria sp.]